jgi:hypothetical protein
MTWQTIVVICVLAVLLALAIIKYVRDNKKGKCSGGCAGCSQSNCAMRKNEDEHSDSKKE